MTIPLKIHQAEVCVSARYWCLDPEGSLLHFLVFQQPKSKFNFDGCFDPN